jgi:ubiquinone biosynthesis protein UbiJ
VDQGIAAWSKLLTQGPPTPDLMAQWKQFLDQGIAAWGKVLEQAMGAEVFAKVLGKQLEQWLSLQGPARKAADQMTEATLAALGIPSRTQVAGIAQQITDLKDRIESLEDKLGTLLSTIDILVKALVAREKPAG